MIYNCNRYNPLINCDMQVAGISRVWLIGFGDIHSFTYQNNDLSKIIDYKLNYLPVELVPCKENSSFTFDFDNSVTNGFNIKMNCSFTPLQHINRTEFEKLIMDRVTMIVRDRNGRCWLLGETSPLRVNVLNGTTGTRGGENIYNLELSSVSSYEPKEITCLDSECFTSFQTSEVRQSIFVIEGASTFDFGTTSVNVTADITPLNMSYSLINQPLQPTLWNNPTILNNDTQTFINLISGYTNSLVVQLFYDNVDDIAYIVLFSQDTSFDNLYFDNNVPIRSSVDIVLNLSFTLGNLLVNSGTSITVTDSSSNVVYSGLYGQTVNGFTGVSGLYNDAYIEIGNLYPNGTTLTLTVNNPDSNCPTRVFTYTPEVLAGCDDFTTIELVEGRRYEITFDKYSVGNSFRHLQFNYNGYLIDLYGYNTAEHSDFNQFDTDFRLALQTFVNSGIDYSSLVIVDQPKTVYINFIAEQDKLCYIRLFGNDLNDSAYVNQSNNMYTSRLYAARTSVVGEFQTLTNGNRITYIDYDLQELAGDVNNVPDVNNFMLLEETDGTTGDINSIGIDVSNAQPSDIYTQTIQSSYCPNRSYLYKIGSCVDTFESNPNELMNYQRYSIQTNSTLLTLNGLNITTNVGTQFVSGVIDLTSDLTDFSESFKMVFPDFILLSVVYLASTSTWYIEVLTTTVENITLIEENVLSYTSVLESQWVCLQYDVLPVQNANQTMILQNETIDPNNILETVVDTTNSVYWREIDRDKVYMELSYSSPTLTISNISNNRGGIQLTFFNGASRAVNLGTYYINPTLLTDSFDLDVLLAGNGYLITDVGLVVINNYEGFEDQFEYLVSIRPDLDVVQKLKGFAVMGRLSSYKVLADNDLAHSAEYEINNIDTCTEFRPRLSNDSGLFSYFNSRIIDMSNFIPKVSTGTLDVTEGTNTAFYTGSSTLIEGTFVTIGLDSSRYYLIRDVRGTIITFSSNVELATGTYDCYEAAVDNIIDVVNNNNLFQADVNKISRVQWQVEQDGLGYIKEGMENYGMLNITDVSLENLTLVGVFRFDSGETVFSHRDSTGQYITYNNKLGNTNITKLKNNPAVVNSVDNTFGNYAIGTFTTNYAFTSTEYAFSAGVNGEPLLYDVNSDSPVESNIQTFGNDFDGTVYVDGFAGRFVDMILTKSVDNFTIQRYEGYLAWKHNLVSLLDATHPYKTVRP